MCKLEKFQMLLAFSSCLGMVLPAPLLQAAGPVAAGHGGEKSAGADRLMVGDVELDATGLLRGLVLDPQGIPVAGARVIVCRGNRQTVAVRTDGFGRFAVGPLRGGSYLLKCQGQGKAVRAWQSNTAPPLAKPLAVMIVGQGVVRGQMPLEDFFASDAVIIAALVAAAIAIPIAVHNSGSKRPSSP